MTTEKLTQTVDKPADVPNDCQSPPDEEGESLFATFGEMVHELIHYRELLWQMILRDWDLRIRYK